MIDWWSVAFNALWILGASILVAAFSYHHWLAGETGRTLRQAFGDLPWRTSNLLGVTLVCVGWMLGQTHSWWARLIWSLPAAWFAGLTIGAIRAQTGSK